MEISQSFRYVLSFIRPFKFSRLCTSDKLWATTVCALHSGMCIRRLCTTTHVIILYARYLPTPPLLHFLFFIPPPPTRSICSTDVCICIYIYTHTHTFCVTAAIGLTLVVRTTNWMNASVILVQDAQSAHEDKSSWRVSIYNNTL